MLEKLCQFLDIRNNERVLVLFLLLNSFFYGLTIVIFESATSALFLAHYSPSMIAIGFITACLLVALLGGLYAYYERRMQPMNLFLLVVSFLLISIASFWMLLIVFDVEWIIFVLFVWKDVITIFFALEFWGLNSLLFDTQQGKRLFGLLGLGEVIGGILAGIFIPSIVLWYGTVNLLLFAMAFMLGVLIMNILIKKVSKERCKLQREAAEEKKPLTFYDLYKKRYLLLIVCIGIFYVLTFYFIEYLFYNASQTLLVDAAAISSFMGIFWAITYAVSFFYRFFLAAPLYQRFGIGLGLMLLPFISLVAMAGAAFFNIFHISFYFVFAMIVLGRLTQGILINAVHEPTYLILYKPLPEHQRLAAQARIEGIIEPIAGGISGIVLLIFTSYFSFGIQTIIYICIAILITWLVTARRLRKEYVALIQHNLSFRETAFLELPSSKKGIEILEKSLNSSYSGDVLYALEIFAKINSSRLKDYCTALIAHKDLVVRTYVLDMIKVQKLPFSHEFLIKRYEEEACWKLKGQLLQLICQCSRSQEELAWAIKFLSSSHTSLMKGAIIGLISYGGIEGVLAAGNRLLEIAKGSDVYLRTLAAEILGDIAITNFYQPLIFLIQDEDKAVRKAALIAAGKLNHPALWQLQIDAFLRGSEKTEAAASIEACGEKIIPLLIQNLSEKSNEMQLISVFRLCGRIKGSAAAAFLLSYCDSIKPALRLSALEGLFHTQFACDESKRQEMRNRLQLEFKIMKHIILSIINLEITDKAILRALHTDLESYKKRILLLYGFIYPVSSYKIVLKYVQTENFELRDYAIQILDDIMSIQDKLTVVPLVEGLSAESILNLVYNEPPPVLTSKSEVLLKIAQNEFSYFSLWSQSYALYLLAQEAPSPEMQQIVSDFVANEEPLLTETAAWILKKWDSRNNFTGENSK